jgi:hypothetical protein
MKVDAYTKFLLTVIALALCLIAARPIVEPFTVNASSGAISSATADIESDIRDIEYELRQIRTQGLKMRIEDTVYVATRSYDTVRVDQE